jgi:hypothetical protein
MGKISDYVNEKYVLVSGVGSSAVGLAAGTGIAAITGTPFLGLTGILAGAVTFAASNIFRYRSQEEIDEILGIEPMELTNAPTGAGQADNPHTLRAMRLHMATIMRKVEGAQESLGRDIVDAIVPVFENLNEIMKQWKQLEGKAEVEYTVEQVIYDYLPTSIEAYTNVSKHERAAKDATLKAELIEQLNILARETGRIRENLFIEDVKPLTSQTHFLKARFGSEDAPQLAIGGNNASEQ